MEGEEGEGEGGDEEGTWLHPKMSFTGMTFQEVFLLHAKLFPTQTPLETRSLYIARAA